MRARPYIYLQQHCLPPCLPPQFHLSGILTINKQHSQGAQKQTYPVRMRWPVPLACAVCPNVVRMYTVEEHLEDLFCRERLHVLRGACNRSNEYWVHPLRQQTPKPKYIMT